MTAMTREKMQASVGQVVGTSKWFTITQPMIDAFADVTMDHQYIHVDPAAAAKTPFGGTIAHGFLTLSLLSAMVYDGLPEMEGVTMGVNYGFDKVRFVSPVPVDARIRAVFTLKDYTEIRPGEVQTTLATTVEIEGQDRPALVADWIGRRYFGENA